MRSTASLLLVVSFLFTFVNGFGIAPSPDYLPSDLRAKVEQLKSDRATKPTTMVELRARTQILWEWANAFSLTGGQLAVNLPAGCATILGPRLTEENFGTYADGIELYIEELRLHEEQPDFLGTLENNFSEPFIAGSYQSIRQTLTVGSKPLRTGASIIVARHFMSNQGVYQTEDPSADNYITIQSSNPNVTFIRSDKPVSGMHGGFRGAAPSLAFEIQSGSLDTGQQLTLTYGDRSGGSKGFLVQTYSNDAFPLPLYLDPDANGNFYSLPIQTYKVDGQAIHGIKGFAPSVVQTGEPFEISVRAEDRYYNRATGPIPAFNLKLSDSNRAIRIIPASVKAITILRDITINQPGIYTFEIESGDGNIQGNSNPVWVQDEPTHRIYWGELHGHSGFAEGQGTPDAFMRFGRDDARLDFLSHTEHDIWMDDFEWQTLINNVKKFNEEGRFITYLGFEWTAQRFYGGHHNILFRTPNNRRRVNIQRAPILSDLFFTLRQENDPNDVLSIPHAHQPGDWRHSDPQLENLVEIMSMHGTYEWFGQAYLDHGHEVGFIAASDDHLSHPGYANPLRRGLAQVGGLAAVLAPEKTTDAIFDAMKNRATYATTGARILLDFTLNGTPMGQRARFSKERHIKAFTYGDDAIKDITLIKNGDILESRDLITSQNPKDSNFLISFHSEIEPENRDASRGWRNWTGTLEVTGGKLNSVDGRAIQNRLAEHLTIDQASNTADFSFITRGESTFLGLQISDTSSRTKIHLRLREDTEYQTTPTSYRQPARVPAQNLTLELSQLKEKGETVAQIKVDDIYTDTITLQRVVSDPPREYQFEYVDSDNPKPDDYYYLRVTQTNGHQAWSSPIWVGGHTHQ